MAVIEHIISTIAPHECIGCSKEGALLCDSCLRGLKTIPSRCYRCHRVTKDFRTCASCRAHSALFAVHALTSYEDVAKELLWKLKFERAKAAAGVIAPALSAMLPAMDGWVVTHIPTAHMRVRARGYDQARLIAKSIAARQQVPYAPLLLRMGTERQVGRKRLERKEQMAKAFVVTKQHALQDKHVVLIDDVITTGSTLEAAAAVLKAAGAKRVSAAVFAAA